MLALYRAGTFFVHSNNMMLALQDLMVGLTRAGKKVNNGLRPALHDKLITNPLQALKSALGQHFLKEIQVISD